MKIFKTSNKVINKILILLNDKILYLLTKIEEKHNELNITYTELDKEYSYIYLISDLVKSIEKYLNVNDEIVSINSYTSPKGNLEIYSTIKRDNVEYFFNTEVIYAGGYNIQKLHYRYITKTNLQKSTNNIVHNELKNELKYIKSLKEQEEIKKKISKLEDELKYYSSFTEEQIVDLLSSKDQYYKFKSWTEMVECGAAINYNNDESFYNSEKEKSHNTSLEFFKSIYIDSRKRTIDTLNKKLNNVSKSKR